jgi:hypothetical protein
MIYLAKPSIPTTHLYLLFLILSTIITLLPIPIHSHPFQSKTTSVAWSTFPPQCHWPALIPPVPCASVSNCIAFLRAQGDVPCVVVPGRSYTPLCESDDGGAVVLGASARGREWGESSACKDVADGLEWVIENCAQCQGKFEDFLLCEGVPICNSFDC